MSRSSSGSSFAGAALQLRLRLLIGRMKTHEPDVIADRSTVAVLVLLLAFVFWPLITHPTEVLSDGKDDLIRGHLPYRVVMSESLRSLSGLPSYNPTAFGGVPLTSDPQAAQTYPPNWLHALSEDGGAV
jgi:hypothetical protein